MRKLSIGLAAAGLGVFSTPASAEIIGGVDFPQGSISFADSVVSYAVGSGGVGSIYQGADNALGVPDYPGDCPSQVACPYVSLGAGGSIVLQFVDNVLTGSDSTADDLWIFEIGPDVEDTFVDLSVDGVAWLSVGKVTGSTRGIDIDFFGYGTGSAFSFVRLTDDYNEGQKTGTTAGADIDAVGAISTRGAVGAVPEPTTWALMILGMGAIGGAMRSVRRKGTLAAARG